MSSLIATAVVLAILCVATTEPVRKYPVPNPPKQGARDSTTLKSDVLTVEYANALKAKMGLWRDLLDQYKAAQQLYYGDSGNIVALAEAMRLMDKIVEVSSELQEDYLSVFGTIPKELLSALENTTNGIKEAKRTMEKAMTTLMKNQRKRDV